MDPRGNLNKFHPEKSSNQKQKRKIYHPPYENPKRVHKSDDTATSLFSSTLINNDNIFTRAIESAQKHNISLQPGRPNPGTGNCSYEAVINNINDRSCFQEEFPMSPDYYRRVWTIDMMNRTLDASSHWNPGLTRQEIVTGFHEMTTSGIYERPFFGDMMMAGIACGIGRRILIFNTNTDIVRTGHDPIAVVDPNDYGGQIVDDIPAVVAYNLVHYESLHPKNQNDIQETIKLTKAYIAKPCKYNELYGFTRNDIITLISATKKKNEDVLQDMEAMDEVKAPNIEENGTMFRFLGEKGSEFYESKEGEIRCGGCTQSFSRIVRHLNQSPYCSKYLNLEEFKSKWNKFTKKRNNERYAQKMKNENEKDFLRKKAERQKKCDQKQKAQNETEFLKNIADRRKKCDQKQKAQNETEFLKNIADRRKKCDQKQKAQNETEFLKDKANRQKKCDQKQKAQNETEFLKNIADRRKKCDQKQKAQNETEFLKNIADRRKKCDQKQKAQNEAEFLKDKANRQKKCDQKQRAQNETEFLKNIADRRKKSDQKQKAQNETEFLKNLADRRKNCDQKQKAQNKTEFLKNNADKQKKCELDKRQGIDAAERYRRFKLSTRYGPIFVCRCCERKLFKHQVVLVDIEDFIEKVEGKEEGLFAQCINDFNLTNTTQLKQTETTSTYRIDQNNHICRGCNLAMLRGKMPKMCANNGLIIDVLPDKSLQLSELENNLIALNIVFQKIHLKPKSRWSGTHDRLVNVPIGEQDVINTVQRLPRSPADACIIPVSLKRKLEYKTTHIEQLIDTTKVYKYLHYLRYVAKNKYYQFYDDYDAFKTRCQDQDPNGFKTLFPQEDDLIESLDSCQNKCYPQDKIKEENDSDSDFEFEKEDFEYRTKDAVRKFQLDYDMTTCMVPKFPEGIPQTEQNDLSVAPGEGKIPSNILREDDWDIKSFPNLHPTGKYGLKEKRDVKLSDQQYIDQRLKNKDTRFEQCTPWIFAQTAYIEEKQLERNIGISFCKGKKITSESGERNYTLNDGFAVLDNIKGTPRYWKKAKMEMLAKLDNFGPFHLFYTLSCGDMRWNENFSCILREKGYNIIWTADNGSVDDCGDVKIEVEFESEEGVERKDIARFLDENADESLHEFIRTNVFIATRNFVQRLKAFRKEIMLGQNNPMAIENWSDKMEFQGRGAAHIHGVAWCNLKKVAEVIKKDMNNNYPLDEEYVSDELPEMSELEKAFFHLRMGGNLSPKEEEALITFADKFVTCTLNPDMAAKMIDENLTIIDGKDIVKIAKETQTHYHTKTCKKVSPDCRFGMPRFPMWTTMLTSPLKGDTVDEKRDRRILHKSILTVVLDVLEDEEEMIKIWKDYDKTNETKEEYVINRRKRIMKVLNVAGVIPEDYVAAVREQTRKGVNVILARDIDEIYINNYNPEWIRAWNANMDLSPCFDFYAVITYITEYFTKDESGTSRLLKLAAKQCADQGLIEQKRCMKNVFLTNRQMGISEAFMKLLPDNRLKDSSIGTEFLPHGKKEDISRFVKRADTQDGEERFDEENKMLFRVPDREGLYYEKPNWIDKFFRRGRKMQPICPSHLAKMYDPLNQKNSKITQDSDSEEDNVDEDNDDFCETVKKYGKEAKFHHFILSDGKPGKKLPEYVELENPLPGEPKFLRKRKHPKALRYYKVKQENNPARFFLQELMFYTTYDEATYEKWHNDDSCIEAYLEKQNEIRAVKKQVMEWLDDVEEARYCVEEAMKNDEKLEEIETMLDAENKQDNIDCEDMGIEADPIYEHLDRGDHSENEFLPSNNWCKTIELKDDGELFAETRLLDKDQRKTLDIFLKYGRDILKARNSNNLIPEAPKIVVIGGAGSGKSTVINCIHQWLQKILQKPGDEPQTPYVLPTATTGAASAIIEGMTIHTGVGLDFSNKHNSLSDKKREMKRDQCKNLKLLIIDEFSMMKSDQLYQIDLRLRELKQNNKVFGGIAICLLGDPAQLKPVKGRFVFDKPVCEDYHLSYGDGSSSLWKNFEVINLTENHRQGGDKDYADLLNRVRIGEQTEDDMDLLRTRVRKKYHPDLKDSLYIAAKRAIVNEHNEKCLNNMKGSLHEIRAKHFTKLKQNFKPYIKENGSISDTQFLDRLKLKIGARVMLIYNVDVSDLLANGAMGTLMAVEMTKDGNVDKLIIKFANPKIGLESRKKHPLYAKKYPEGTVITKIDREYTISKRVSTDIGSTAHLIQFPIILAFAVTVHKVQGQTIDRPLKVVMDLRSVFEGAQGYVMLSRIKELLQLYILEELPEKKLYPIERALVEIKRLEEVSMNKNPKSWDKKARSGIEKISFLNVRSLINKFENIRADWSLQQSKIIILGETWIPRDIEQTKEYEIDGFYSHMNNSGRGRGLAVFQKEECTKITDHNAENINVTKIEGTELNIIAIYRGQEGSLSRLIEILENILSQSKTTLIIGDINICNKKNPNNNLKRYLEEKNFKEVIKKSTHTEGSHIDHAYVMNVGNFVEFPEVVLIPKYYSDHDAICITWQKLNEKEHRQKT